MRREPYLQDPDLTLWHGDALEVLRGMDAGSVNCALTSPAFYGLRDYGTGRWEGGDAECDHSRRTSTKTGSSTLKYPATNNNHEREGWKGGICGKCGARSIDQQIGLEDTPDEWVARLVAVFAEVRRVLADNGTLWVECGDSYNGSTQGGGNTNRVGGGTKRLDELHDEQGHVSMRVRGLKPKDLLLQPFMLAMALRDDGWWLRQIIIWHKPNAMPESATDRCTTAHSYVFLLSKSARYWFDASAIAEPAAWERWGDQSVPKYEGTPTASGWMQPKTKAEIRAIDGYSRRRGSDHRDTRDDVKGEREAPAVTINSTKNPRSVWTIPTRGYAGAHFATWPEALVERIIKAGCPEGGTVLDPFAGSGTTALVARRHGRRSVLIELSADYCALAARRLQQLSLLAEAAP